MVQFNLLPDVKLAYIKAQRLKRIVMSAALVVAAAVIGVVLLLAITVYGVQNKHLGDINRDIDSAKNNLNATADLNKILTVQNQLSRLPELHQQKPAVSRVFEYLEKLVPAGVTIQEVKIDFVESTMEITGSADSIANVNQFVDTMKFTTYAELESEEYLKAFNEVVVAQFDRDAEGAAYKVTAKFDPAIFDGTKNDSQKQVLLKIPSITSSRSEVEKPALFKQSEEE